MLKLKWINVTITTNKQANEMVAQFHNLKPSIGGFDTESNGLHIILSSPFLFQFGYIVPERGEGYTYVVDLEKQPILARTVIQAWHKLAETLDIYFAHNIKFDLHMLTNIGLPYTADNISDTMFYIRHAHDALTPANGGPPLGLKPYSARYVDASAKAHESLLNTEKTSIIKKLHQKLRKRTGLSMKKLTEIFKDQTLEIEDLPEDIKSKYLDWLQLDVPIWLQSKVNGLLDPDMIPYDKLNRTNIIKYGHYDIVLMLEVYLKTWPVIQARGTEIGIEYENRIIYALWEMERVGFKVDVDYIKECKVKMKNYINRRRNEFYNLAGTELSIGQHALIKQIFETKYGIPLESTNADGLDLLKSDLEREQPGHEAIEFINLLQELRTLEKWYSTYILRFLRDLRNTDRLYTTINQVGTVSGRVTSDFQQFPKKGLKTVEGEELFQPRSMVYVNGDGGYDSIVYLDYSQIELRFQALYTILVGHADTNLCRAYMPYNCISPDGKCMDYNNPDDIRNWKGDWYYKENPQEHWEPTDVHGATTTEAFGIVKGHPDFHDLRYIGKRVNFARLNG